MRSHLATAALVLALLAAASSGSLTASTPRHPSLASFGEPNVTHVASIAQNANASLFGGTAQYKDLVYSQMHGEIVATNLTTKAVQFRVKLVVRGGTTELDTFRVFGGVLLAKTGTLYPQGVAAWDTNGALLFLIGGSHRIPLFSGDLPGVSYVPGGSGPLDSPDYLYYADEASGNWMRLSLTGSQQGSLVLIRRSITSSAISSSRAWFSHATPGLVYTMITPANQAPGSHLRQLTAVDLVQNETKWTVGNFSLPSNVDGAQYFCVFTGEDNRHLFFTFQGLYSFGVVAVFRKQQQGGPGAGAPAAPVLVRYGTRSVSSTPGEAFTQVNFKDSYAPFLPHVDAAGTTVTFVNDTTVPLMGSLTVASLTTGAILSSTPLLNVSNNNPPRPLVVGAPGSHTGRSTVTMWGDDQFLSFDFPSGAIVTRRNFLRATTFGQTLLGDSGLVLAATGFTNVVHYLQIRDASSGTGVWEKAFAPESSDTELPGPVTVFPELSVFTFVDIKNNLEVYSYGRH